jgi:hypothetical protein
MKKLFLLLIVIILAGINQSCRKNSTVDLNADVNVANDAVISISSYTSIFNFLIKARLDSSIISHGFSFIDGAIVTYNSGSKSYDFSFGNQYSPDSVQRTGSIQFVMSGDILQMGSYAMVSFQNYNEDYGRVTGTDSIVNEGTNALNQMVFQDYISHGTIDKGKGDGILTVSINEKLTVQASSIFTGQDIIFLIQGSISGKSSKGYTFSASTRDTLLNSISCPWIEGGIIDAHIPDVQVPDGYIEFGKNKGCSDVIWYYFENASFRVKKNKYYLSN